MNNRPVVKHVTKSGFEFGVCLAMIMSWTTWHSIGWALVHGFFSWFYVIYYFFTYMN